MLRLHLREGQMGGREHHSKPRGRRSLGEGRGMASVVQCAGAGPGPPAPRVRAAGPDDVARCRPPGEPPGKPAPPELSVA